MNKTTVSKMIFGAVLLLFTACTQDELAEQGNTLPDGEYPLQIGSVSMSVESSEEPWTRVSESTDGKSSVWETGDEFYVKFEGSDEVGTYRITDAATGAVEAVTPIYWKSTQPANIIAWYAKPQLYANNWMDLRDQENGLAYVLRATADNASYDTQVSLQFKHQLAKVRVVTKGTVNVRSISIRYPFSCFVNEGIVTPDGPPQFLDLYKTHYEGIGTCWEINLPVGNDNIEVCRVIPIENSAMMRNVQLTSPVTLEADKVHTITITANWEGTQTIDLSTLTAPYEIDDSGTYYATGSGQYGIRVTNGEPDIYLEDAQISVSSGNAIDIQGGSPTIHVRGEGNTITSSDKTGIFVAENSTVTITGNGREDKLTVRGGAGSSGIGGYLSREDPAPACGNIEITSVWIEAYGSKSINFEVAPGIGGAGSASCGTITIDDATVYAYGIEAFPIGSSSAIGGGFDRLENKGSFGTITIRNNSEVYVQRGDSYSDYIGNSGTMYDPATATDGIDATVDETSTVTKLN
ncbi:fimbrillin family protein [Phocaeicola barnesiae]